MYLYFFFNDTATTEIYTLSLHDALPIFTALFVAVGGALGGQSGMTTALLFAGLMNFVMYFASSSIVLRMYGAQKDRKSTRLNSSHANISYAVFCLNKKNKMLKVTSFGYV